MLTRRNFSMGSGAALLAGAHNSARAQPEGRIILGQSAAFTGPAAQLGIQFYQGAKVYFDQVNAQGGIGRQQIEIRMLDDGYEPARCAENTRRLIAGEVFALFGYIGTPTSLAALAVKTLVAARPNAVVQIGAYKGCAAFVREARKAGYGGTFYNVSFVGTQALADELGKDGAGMVISQVVPSPYNAARPIAREFAEALKAAGSKEVQVNFFSMEGCLGVWAAERASATNRSQRSIFRRFLGKYPDIYRRNRQKLSSLGPIFASTPSAAQTPSRQGIWRRPAAGRQQANPRIADDRPGEHQQPVVWRLCGVFQAEPPCGIEFCRAFNAHRRQPRTHLTGPRPLVPGVPTA